MRVAVCLSGQPRSLGICAPEIRQKLLNDLPCDFFIHFWCAQPMPNRSFEEYISDRSSYMKIFRRRTLRRRYEKWKQSKKERDESFHTQREAIVEDARRAYEPVELVVEEQIQFDTEPFEGSPMFVFSKRRNQPFNVQNTRSMYYSLKKANALKRAHEKKHGFRYDLVVRCRPDLFFFSRFPLHEFLPVARRMLLLPNRGFALDGVNDQLAISSSVNMDIYSATFDFLEKHYAHSGYFQPENILFSHLRETGLELCFSPFDYEIARGSWGSAREYEEEAVRSDFPVGPFAWHVKSSGRLRERWEELVS